MTPHDASAERESTLLTEQIDTRSGVVSARGVLTRPGADLLRGAVEALARLGHRRITLDLSGLNSADDDGVVALAKLDERIAAGSRPGLVVVRPPWGAC